MAHTVTDIANYLIWRVNSDTESGDNISNLKLQKLVYYAQGFHLAWYGKPLFPEEIRSWSHGPVVYELYNSYRSYGSEAIPTPEDYDPSHLDDQTRELLEEVYNVYGQYSAWGLRNLTHEEPPWKDTPRNEPIPHEVMRSYFADSLTVDPVG